MRVAAVAVALVAASACGRIGYDGVSPEETDGPPGVRPIHEYLLRGNLDDERGGPSLQSGGGMVLPDGYRFAANQGLAVTGAMPPRVYTVDLVFSFDVLGDTWRKILDFKQLGTDEGFYTYMTHLQYVVVAGSVFADGARTLTAGTEYQVTLTRDAGGEVVGYVDRVEQLRFDDTGAVAALDTAEIAHFFIDDAATSGMESSGGVVRRIRIWDVPLAVDQIPP